MTGRCAFNGRFGIEALVLRVKLTKQQLSKQHGKTTSLSLHGLYSPLIQNPVKIRLSTQTNQTARRNNATKQQDLVCFFCYQ
jgi:hypothetical protein